MLKLKLKYFGHLMRRVDSLEKTLMLGGIEGRKRSGRQRMRWPDGITDLMDMILSKLREFVMNGGRTGMLQFMESQRVGQDWVTELNWTEQRRDSLIIICSLEIRLTASKLPLLSFLSGREAHGNLGKDAPQVESKVNVCDARGGLWHPSNYVSQKFQMSRT